MDEIELKGGVRIATPEHLSREAVLVNELSAQLEPGA